MVFIETAFFTRYISDYLTDEEQGALQGHLIEHPDEGDIIPGTGGVRKSAGGQRVKESAVASGSFTTGGRREATYTC